MTSVKRLLRVNGQSDLADRLDQAEVLRAGVAVKPHKSYIDKMLDAAREEEREYEEAVERQYQHIMRNGGKAHRARQHALWDQAGQPTRHATTTSRPLSTKACRPYFAYGMNTNVEQMARRCPDAKPIGAYTLKGHKLVFRTYADIVRKRGASVAGVLWYISEKCERALDKLEGYPRAYKKGRFTARVNGKNLTVMYYYMTEGRRVANPPPAHYLTAILGGYESFGLDKAPLVRAAQDAYDAMPKFSENVAPAADNDEEEFF